MWQLHGCPPLQKIMSGRLQSLVSLSKCVQRGALKIKVFHISLLYFTGTLFWRSGENLNACWDNQAARQQVVFFVFFTVPIQCQKAFTQHHRVQRSRRNLNLTKVPKQTSSLYLGVDTHWEIIWYSNWGAGWTARWGWYHLDKVPTQKLQCWVK